jgi:hypothetical protein
MITVIKVDLTQSRIIVYSSLGNDYVSSSTSYFMAKFSKDYFFFVGGITSFDYLQPSSSSTSPRAYLSKMSTSEIEMFGNETCNNYTLTFGTANKTKSTIFTT